MGRCVILCAGEFGAINLNLTPEDFIICCDGGYDYAVKLGVLPHLIIGDFDSVSAADFNGVKLMRYPVEKDDTDSMLAVKEGIKQGFDEFVLLFSLGGRLDHTLANVQALAFLKENHCNGQLIGPFDCVSLLESEHCVVSRKENQTLSVFSYGGAAHGVTLRGVKYPLESATLSDSFPIGLGNSVVEKTAFIEVLQGRLLLVESCLR